MQGFSQRRQYTAWAGSYKVIIRMCTKRTKEKFLEVTGQREFISFYISLLYEVLERQRTKIESNAIGTRVVFRPEKLTMQADMSKSRMTESLMR